MTTLIFDTETTGLIKHPRAKDAIQPRIIEWAGALVDEKGKITDELDVLINPDYPLPEKIISITGITDNMLIGQPKIRDVMKMIRPYFASADAMIAHNLPFDKGMMCLELARLEIRKWPWPEIQICTVQEHAEEFGKFPKLTELYEHYLGKPLAQTHRAMDDVYALICICIKARLLK